MNARFAAISMKGKGCQKTLPVPSAAKLQHTLIKWSSFERLSHEGEETGIHEKLHLFYFWAQFFTF